MYEALMLANILLWVAMVVIFIRQPSASIYHPFVFYLAFHFLVFAMRAPLVYYRNYDLIYRAYQFQPSLENKSVALIVAMLGLASFGAGCMYFARTPVTFDRLSSDEAARDKLIGPFAPTLLLLAPIAIYSMFTSWVADITGVATMVRDQATGIAINTGSNGYLYESRLMLGPLALIFAWITRFRWYSFIPMVVFLILGGGTGTRGPFMLASVGLGLLWLHERKSYWPTPRAVAFLAVLLAFFTLVGADRGETIRGLFVNDQVEGYVSAMEGARFLEGMDTGNLEYVEYLTYTIPEQTGTYGYFTNLLQIFTEPVPRVLWPDKPIGEPIKMFNLFDYGNPIGMTSSLPGQGWLNLGYAGVVIWCGLFGMLWGWIYERFARRRATNLSLLTYLTILPLSILFLRDGGPITMLRYGLFLALPIVVFAICVKLWGIGRSEDPLATAAHGYPRQSGAARRTALASGGENSAGRVNRRRRAGQLQPP